MGGRAGKCMGGWGCTLWQLNRAFAVLTCRRITARLPSAPRLRIKTVRFIHGQVQEAGYRAALLHGERSQEEREAAVADFRSGKVQVRQRGTHGSTPIALGHLRQLAPGKRRW